MPEEWYYTSNGQQYGPVTSGQLKQLAATAVIQRDDQVWKEGLKEWRPARNVRGLFPQDPQTTPCNEKSPQTAPPSADLAVTASAFGQALLAAGKKKIEEVSGNVAPIAAPPNPIGSTSVAAASTEPSKKGGKLALGTGILISGVGCFGMLMLCGTCGLLGTILPNLSLRESSVQNGNISGETKDLQGTWSAKESDFDIRWMFQGDRLTESVTPISKQAKEQFKSEKWTYDVTVNNATSPKRFVLQRMFKNFYHETRGVFELSEQGLTVCCVSHHSSNSPVPSDGFTFKGLTSDGYPERLYSRAQCDSLISQWNEQRAGESLDAWQKRMLGLGRQVVVHHFRKL